MSTPDFKKAVTVLHTTPVEISDDLFRQIISADGWQPDNYPAGQPTELTDQQLTDLGVWLPKKAYIVETIEVPAHIRYMRSASRKSEEYHPVTGQGGPLTWTVSRIEVPSTVEVKLSGGPYGRDRAKNGQPSQPRVYHMYWIEGRWCHLPPEFLFSAPRPVESWSREITPWW